MAISMRVMLILIPKAKLFAYLNPTDVVVRLKEDCSSFFWDQMRIVNHNEIGGLIWDRLVCGESQGGGGGKTWDIHARVLLIG